MGAIGQKTMEKTAHAERKPHFQLLEEELFAWADNLHKQDTIVNTKQIIIQAFAIARYSFQCISHEGETIFLGLI
jgi:hypothetical protein